MTKWPTICRRQFWNALFLNSIYSSLNHMSLNFCSSDLQAKKWPTTITLTNDDPVHWHIYASPGRDELTHWALEIAIYTKFIIWTHWIGSIPDVRYQKVNVNINCGKLNKHQETYFPTKLSKIVKVLLSKACEKAVMPLPENVNPIAVWQPTKWQMDNDITTQEPALEKKRSPLGVN